VYVVPFAPGGNTDTLARLLNQKLAATLGQPVVIENKPGAGGNIGSDFVAKAKPDGYTILGGTISSHAINPSVYPNMPYDAVKSFEPVILLGSNPLVFAVNASTPYKSLKEVLDAAKAKPGQLAFASPGPGTSPHLAGELLKSLTQVDLTHVPYKGSGPALSDAIGGQVPIIIDTTLVLGAQIKAGKLRPLAVAYPKRLATLPDVPTAAEAGVPGWEVVSWQAVFRARRYAEADRTATQYGDRCHHENARCAGAAGRTGCGGRRRATRAARGIPEGGDRQMVEGGEGRWREAGVTLSPRRNIEREASAAMLGAPCSEVAQRPRVVGGYRPRIERPFCTSSATKSSNAVISTASSASSSAR
jgi:tripartite-type tricarboxylate transporter receptor subunit TctC